MFSATNRSVDGALPNQPFVSVDRLQEVQGVSAEVLATLRPYLTAVPYYLPININTASPALLAALIDGAAVSRCKGWSTRSKQNSASVDELATANFEWLR